MTMPVTTGPKNTTGIYDPANMEIKMTNAGKNGDDEYAAATAFSEAQQDVDASALQHTYDKHVDAGPAEYMKHLVETNPRMLKPLPVHGYPDVEQSTVDLVNENKIIEEKLLRVVDDLISRYDIDPRWAAMSRTSFELGFMQLNRAVFKPARIALPGDPEPVEQTAPTTVEPQAPVDYNRDTTTDGGTGEPGPTAA